MGPALGSESVGGWSAEVCLSPGTAADMLFQHVVKVRTITSILEKQKEILIADTCDEIHAVGSSGVGI